MTLTQQKNGRNIAILCFNFNCNNFLGLSEPDYKTLPTFGHISAQLSQHRRISMAHLTSSHGALVWAQ